MLKRRRFNQTTPFYNRIDQWADSIRRQTNDLPPGPEREELVKKLHQAETAMHLDAWANSAELQPPK